MRMIQEMGREWEGIGRGILSRPPLISPQGGNGRGLEEGYATRPPNIPPYPPPHTVLFTMVWGEGDRGGLGLGGSILAKLA